MGPILALIAPSPLYIILYIIPKKKSKKYPKIFINIANNSVCAILSRLWYEIDIEEPVLF